jgi:hypothetical protein
MRSFNQGHFIVLAALCGSVVAFSACGDDDDSPTGAGGSSGTGGAGTGGRAGTAGTGGTTGSGGSGGSKDAGVDARDGAGGNAGSAGSAGSAGKGGAAGAAGAGGKAGSAGASGAAGKDGGSSDASADGDASPMMANVRVAHLSPGAPAVDFCLAAHGTTVFTGPVLAGQAVLTGLPYASVTKYQTLAAGQYDVRIVAPGSANCATSFGGLPDQTNLPLIAGGSAVTIAALGELSPGDGGGNPFSMKAYVDDTSVSAGNAKLRFVHASSGTQSVDVGTGGGVLFTTLFNDVAFSNVASATNGYIETPPLANTEISTRLHGTTSDVLSVPSAELASGAIATAFAIGKPGNIATPLKVLLCLDNGASVGALTPCTVVGETPKRAHVRVAHLSPDVPAIDVCLAPTGSAFAGTGILRRLNVTAGLAYPQVTTYLDVPVSSYTVRLVLATATDCNTAVVPDTPNVVVADELYATIAALGDLTVPPSDGGAAEGGTVDGGAADAGTTSSFGLKVFVDDKAAPVPAGNINLRFIHASPGTAAVDVGLGSGGAFTPIFTNVAFRNFGVGVGIDPNGYVSTAPLAAQTLSARLSGGTTDAIVVPNVTVTAGSLATAFAIGKISDGNKPLKVLLCMDSSAAVGALTPCNVLP